MYYKRAIINCYNSGGHVKLRHMKMSIDVINTGWEGAGTLGVVVQCKTQPCVGGKVEIKERFALQAHHSYLWNHIRWANVSNFTTIRGMPIDGHMHTSLQSEFQPRGREALYVKAKKSQTQDTRYTDTHYIFPSMFSCKCYLS